MKVIHVEGHDWHVEAIREDGQKLVVTVKGGQEIVTRGAVAILVSAAFKEPEAAKPPEVAKEPEAAKPPKASLFKQKP